MDLSYVQAFIENEKMATEVKAYILRCFQDFAMNAVYKSEDTRHFAEAKKIIDQSFIKMKSEFQKRPTRRTNIAQ